MAVTAAAQFVGAGPVARGAIRVASGAMKAGRKAAEISKHVETAARLKFYTAQAKKTYTLTRPQQAALKRRPQLERAFVGDRIDAIVKAKVAKDKRLAHLTICPRFQKGSAARMGDT